MQLNIKYKHVIEWQTAIRPYYRRHTLNAVFVSSTVQRSTVAFRVICKLQIANLHTSCPWQNSTLLKAIRVIPHSTLPAPPPHFPKKISLCHILITQPKCCAWVLFVRIQMFCNYLYVLAIIVNKDMKAGIWVIENVQPGFF